MTVNSPHTLKSKHWVRFWRRGKISIYTFYDPISEKNLEALSPKTHGYDERKTAVSSLLIMKYSSDGFLGQFGLSGYISSSRKPGLRGKSAVSSEIIRR